MSDLLSTLESVNQHTTCPHNWREKAMSDAAVEIERLRARLDAIKRHWQFGVQDIDNPCKRKMAELVGDAEGLDETGGDDE